MAERECELNLFAVRFHMVIQTTVDSKQLIELLEITCCGLYNYCIGTTSLLLELVMTKL